MQRTLRTQFAYHLVVAAVTVMCFIVGQEVQQPAVSWLAAALLVIAFGFLIRPTRPEAALLAALFMTLTFALWPMPLWPTPLPSSILIAFSAALFGVLLTSVSFSDLFTGTGTSPFTYVLRRYTGQLLEAQVLTVPKGAVEDGDAGKIGPRPVIIPANTAVLLIAADQRARVRGPGMYVSRPFEHVAKVFSLRPIKRNYRFRDVLTDDNTPLAIEVDITYGIDVREDGRLWARGLNQRDRANLRHIVASTPDWETALRDVVDRNLRNAVGTCDLGDILDPGQQRNVSARTARTVRTDTQGWGVRVYDFELIAVQPDTSVIEASVQNWLLNVTNDMLQRKESARGEAWAMALAPIVRAYQAANQIDVPDAIINRELVRRLFEQASLDTNTKHLLQSELAQMMARRDVDREHPPGS